jgi:hypothetical protein
MAILKPLRSVYRVNDNNVLIFSFPSSKGNKNAFISIPHLLTPFFDYKRVKDACDESLIPIHGNAISILI